MRNRPVPSDSVDMLSLGSGTAIHSVLTEVFPSLLELLSGTTFKIDQQSDQVMNCPDQSWEESLDGLR